MEILKLASWSETEPRVYHYRDHRGGEVDLVLEDRTGRIVAIEIKAKVSLSSADTKSLVKLRNALGENFLAGVILHAGEQTIPLGERLWAIPVSGLWA